MALPRTLALLGQRAATELEALRIYCQHTEAVWDSLMDAMSRGHVARIPVPATGQLATAQELNTLSLRYRDAYLLPFAFQHLIALFEYFFFDFLKALLVNNPLQLSQRKQIEVGLALSVPDRAALIELIAERELNEIKYRKPREWFEYLDRLVRLGCPTVDEIDSLAEIKACRDVLAHNVGTANVIYLDEAGAKARWSLDQQVIIDPPYFHDCMTLIRKIIQDLSAAAAARFTTP